MIDENNASVEITRVRKSLNAVLDDPQISGVLGSEFVSELKEWDALIGKKMDEPFTLVILGEFKRGKSTIINAILGKDLTPTNATPETYTINEITFGNFRTVQAFLENGRRVPLTIDDIKREKLEQRMKMFPSKISYIQIKDNSPILSEIKIVDTPGLSDLESLDKEVRDYIVNAD
ncbi:MAG: dynamin family protein, partial [Ruminococcus sp.]|nr:dynamin family protein [Ruminococcus sp.]